MVRGVGLEELPVLRKRVLESEGVSPLTRVSQNSRKYSTVESTVPMIQPVHAVLPLYLGHHTQPSMSYPQAACGIFSCLGGALHSTPRVEREGPWLCEVR